MLKDAIRNMARKPIHLPNLLILSIKELPTIGNVTANVAICNKSKQDLKKEIEEKNIQERNTNTTIYECNIYSIKQPPTAFNFQVGI